MRVLLDEDVTRRLRRELPAHEVATVVEMDWQGKKNGELLALANLSFDVLVTGDRNMRFQQNLSRLRNLGIVVIAARNTNINTLRTGIGVIDDAIRAVSPGTVVEVAIPG